MRLSINEYFDTIGWFDYFNANLLSRLPLLDRKVILLEELEKRFSVKTLDKLLLVFTKMWDKHSFDLYYRKYSNELENSWMQYDHYLTFLSNWPTIHTDYKTAYELLLQDKDMFVENGLWEQFSIIEGYLLEKISN